MKVIVNKREKIMPENISILEMMKFLNHGDTSSIALAVNEEVISQTKWEETKLKDGDKITIIQATCGG
ncbi:MAG: sulfur carrier protein ThiS [Bacteroidales bacterium]|nr:sulfur carrier protein ThiS [Bacteroidales bacterium]MDD4683987.1 sulfur carrier protein ThiS [Bacteroidales bacterium]